jgi:nucleotide-binding universal stress UspA family protein
VAFRAAAQRGLSVAAVHAWTTDPPPTHEGVCGLAAMSRARALAALEQALSPWRDRFADVAVDARLVCADPAAALIRESDGAALLVVGSRGRGTARAKMFGSVSRSVIQRARCPVTVVRPGEARPVKTGRTGRRAVIRTGERTGPQNVQRRRPPWE